MSVAVLVLNRNMREMTEDLIRRIRETTDMAGVRIYNVDSASDEGQVARNADEDIILPENRRWAFSFNRAILTVGTGYDFYWCVCNDTRITDDGTLDRLVGTAPADAAQVHPHQKTPPRGSSQTPGGGGMHPSSFVEFVCPLLPGKFVRRCMAEWGMPGISDGFPYGWGVDYEMAYLGHRLGLRSYVSGDVGIVHEPGTTHRNHERTKVEPDEQMRRNARNSMLDVLEQRYGRDWGEVFARASREAGVDPHAFLEWSKYDRGLSLAGVRA